MKQQLSIAAQRDAGTRGLEALGSQPIKVASLEDAEGDGQMFYRAWNALIDGFSLAGELSAAGRPEPEHRPSSPE